MKIDPILPFEYTVHLSTGESIEVAELDPGRIPALSDPIVLKILSGMTDKCTFASREIMDEVHKGYDERFKVLLKSPPLGAMQKAGPPVCRQINDCAMAVKSVCTLRNYSKKTPLPLCWEFDSDNPEAVALGTVIGNAWRQGQYVIIITSSRQ